MAAVLPLFVGGMPTLMISHGLLVHQPGQKLLSRWLARDVLGSYRHLSGRW